MAALDPESETDADRRRWSWTETMRQLLYRYASPSNFLLCQPSLVTHSYEKELNCGARPALRLITAQDVSTGLHMILCVSGITWSAGGIGNDGLPLVPHPTLELTDGWYRLRTQVDEVLARAARRGIIRVGRKIAVSGASVRASGFCRCLRESAHQISFRATRNLARCWRRTTKSNLSSRGMELIPHPGTPSLASNRAQLLRRFIRSLQTEGLYPVSSWL